MSPIERRSLLRGAAVAAVGGALSQGIETPAGAEAGAAHCTTPSARDFPKVGGNYGNQNYSCLQDISRGNIRRLGGAWLNRIEGGLTTGTNQSTAVAVGGVLFIESAPGNVHAVDGATGTTKWVYRQTRGALTRRGVGVGQGMVFTHGRGDWIIALDQETGQVVWEKQISEYGNMEKVAVTYHDGLLHCGTHDGGRCAALALDARDGDVVWHFFGTPGPGEPGNETWEGDSWQEGGATPWMHPAIDPELGLVFWTFGNAHAVLAGARQRHPHHRRRSAVHRPARRLPAGAGRPRRKRAVALPMRRRARVRRSLRRHPVLRPRRAPDGDVVVLAKDPVTDGLPRRWGFKDMGKLPFCT